MFTPNLPVLALAALFLASGLPDSLFGQRNSRPDFSQYYELEPIQVTGEEIPITVFARSASDRRYATRFAHKVVEVVYLTLEKSPGSGLVIMGKSGEPHPVPILQQFLARSKSDSASPEMRRIGQELQKTLDEWKAKIEFDDSDQEDVPFEIDSVIPAFPLPLDGIAAELYLIAWQEEFDNERIEKRLDQLDLASLGSSEFREFNWIFYLPPRNALNKVIKEVLPAAMKAEKIGFMKRILIRGAVAAIKPILRDAMEGLRKGVLYWSVLQSTGELEKGDLDALVQAYIGSQMPRGKIIGGNKQERGIEAVLAQKKANEEYAKDPFVIPQLLEEYQVSNYNRFAGGYGAEGHRSKRFFVQDGSIFWQEGDDEPVEYFPASETFLVSENEDITIEFLRHDFGQYSSVELRKGRMRWTFQRFPDVSLD